MAVWKIDIPVTGSMTVEIHADTEDEAREIHAEGEYEPAVDLCVQCSGYATHINEFPVRFSLDLDQIDNQTFEQFTPEG